MATQDSDLPFHEPSTTEKIEDRLVESGVATVLKYTGLAVALLWTLCPVYWIVTATLKTRQTLLTFPPQWIPTDLQFGNFLQLFADRPEFAKFIINSVIVTSVTTVLATSIGAVAAYGFVTFDFPYSLDFHLPFYILSTRFMPPIVTIIPLFIIFRNIGLVNTIPGLIIAYTAFNIPFVVWVTKGFFEEIPDSIVESAIIDGHTHVGAFFKIVLPLVKPGLLAAAIFTIITTWNELLFAIILTLDKKSVTIPVGLSSFVTKYLVQWINMAVGGTIALLPVLLFAFIAREQLVRGFSMGAVGK
jgi:multiple sugar transport system permease protein